MPHFCVTVQGDGLDIPSNEGGKPIVGFYSVSRLRADNLSHASELAAARCRERLGRVLSRSGGSAPSLALTIDEVVRCRWYEALMWPGGGFIFYSADDA